jgi:hypothetical protein
MRRFNTGRTCCAGFKRNGHCELDTSSAGTHSQRAPQKRLGGLIWDLYANL